VPPLATEVKLAEIDDDAEGGGEGGDDDDPMLHDAAKLVSTHQPGSTSLPRRGLKVGYARAGRCSA